MIDSLHSSTEKTLKEVIEKAKFVGITIDESIDVAVFKRLMIYIQVSTTMISSGFQVTSI